MKHVRFYGRVVVEIPVETDDDNVAFRVASNRVKLIDIELLDPYEVVGTWEIEDGWGFAEVRN